MAPGLTSAQRVASRPPALDDSAIRAALADVLASRHFAHAPRLSRFLSYIVTESLEGRADSIKEYALAADVFGRGDDYDSSTDAIVRVEASRLRQKLHAYYDEEGRNAAWLFELPKGTYVPRVECRASVATSEGPGTVARRRPSWVWLSVVVLLGIIVVGSVAMLRVTGTSRGDAPPHSTNPEATDAYLKGVYLRSQMTSASIGESVPWFERAVAADGGFAAAWAALGEARATLAFHGLRPRAATLGLARHDVERALELAPRQADARGLLARIHLVDDFDWARAEPEFRAALRSAPGNARLHQWFAFALVSRGRFAEAIDESRRARELNPQAYVGTTDTAVLLFFARRYDEALRQARQAHTVNARMSMAHVVAGMCLVAMGRHDEAVDEYRDAGDDDLALTAVPAKLAHVYGLMGRGDAARAEAARLQRVFTPGPPPPLDRALVALGVGDTDEALRALAAGLEERDGDLLFLGVHPLLDPLRDDPRFTALLHRAGL